MRFEPDWRPRLSLLRPPAPPGLRAWLTCPDSLTRAVSRGCGATFRVRLLQQGWECPREDERRALGLPHACRAVVRQVFLNCGDQPRVYARTVIPRSSLSGAPRRLLRLGDTPLGEVLFATPSLQREREAFAHLTPAHGLYRLAASAAETHASRGLWARRAVYRLAGLPLLVTEVFLPSLTRRRPCPGGRARSR